MTHKYALILNAIMEGKTIQVLYEDGTYNDIDEDDALCHLGFATGGTLRVKPDVVNIAGIAVAKPMTNLPAIDQRYFYIVPWSTDRVESEVWRGSVGDHLALNSGMCWHTRDDAVNAAAAIKKLLMGG